MLESYLSSLSRNELNLIESFTVFQRAYPYVWDVGVGLENTRPSRRKRIPSTGTTRMYKVHDLTNFFFIEGKTAERALGGGM